jgi:ATP-dependent Clp protease ATP-binding subunit ClpC
MFLNVKATEGINTVIKAATKVAARYNNNQISLEHILYGLSFNEHSVSGSVLAEFNITSADILRVLEQAKNQTNTSSSAPNAKATEHLFKVAGELSQNLGSEFMSTEHLLYALLNEKNSIATAMIEQVFLVKIEQIKLRLNEILGLNREDIINEEYEQKAEDNIESNLPKELLDMGSDLTLKAFKGKTEPIIGRKNELERMIQVLCRKSKNNPIIIGQSGVGKSAVVDGLAQKIVKGEVPENLQNKIIFSLEIGSLMAGTRYRGALEEKLKKAIDIIINREDIILFIDEIHTIMQAGEGKGEVSPADMLKPYLSGGDLQTIGATTVSEYEKFIEKDKALERRFQPILVNPPTTTETIQILEGLKAGYEKYHSVRITQEAIEAAVRLSDRYVTDRNLPDKAIDLIDEASSKARVSTKSIGKIIKEKEDELKELLTKKQNLISSDNFNLSAQIKEKISNLEKELYELNARLEEDSDRVVIGEEEVARVVASWTGVPVNKITENEKSKLLNLEEELHKRVIGQNEAVAAVANAIKRARVGLKDTNKPIGSFIFVGQTGIGKTELCRALAESMFNDEAAIIKLDMSEFMEAHSVSKLIGAPAGYVGYEDGGLLTDAVRRKPYSVVLFDEIEKAHRDVFNLMLQVLDEGKLTDSKGTVVNFKNTIIIFTSNIGVDKLPQAKKLKEASGEEFDFEAVKEVLTKALKGNFKPEFLNRIDQTIVFEPLKSSELAQIAKIMIIRLNNKLKAKNLTLKLTETAFKYLIKKGTNEEYGARLLRRVLETEIEDKLTQDLLMGNLLEGSTIVLDSQSENLIFRYNLKN